MNFAVRYQVSTIYSLVISVSHNLYSYTVYYNVNITVYYYNVLHECTRGAKQGGGGWGGLNPPLNFGWGG